MWDFRLWALLDSPLWCLPRWGRAIAASGLHRWPHSFSGCSWVVEFDGHLWRIGGWAVDRRTLWSWYSWELLTVGVDSWTTRNCYSSTMADGLKLIVKNKMLVQPPFEQGLGLGNRDYQSQEHANNLWPPGCPYHPKKNPARLTNCKYSIRISTKANRFKSHLITGPWKWAFTSIRDTNV